MWAESLTYGPSPFGGVNTGVYGFDLRLSGETPISKELTKIAVVLEKNRATGPNILFLSGKYNPDLSNLTLSFTTALKESGWFIGALSDGETRFPWFNNIDHLMVFPEDPTEWLKFRCNEFVAKINAHSKPDSILLPPVWKGKTIYCNLSPTNEKALIRFIKKSPIFWRLYVQPLNDGSDRKNLLEEME